MVNENKTNLIIQGQGYLNTEITWNDTANSTGGTVYSSTVSVFATNFIAYNISFKVMNASISHRFGIATNIFSFCHLIN